MGQGKASTPVYTKRIVWNTQTISQNAWAVFEANLPVNVKELEIFDSSGQSMVIGVGATGNEQACFTMPPGGDAPFPAKILLGKGTQINIKPLDAAISGSSPGFILVNGYY